MSRGSMVKLIFTQPPFANQSCLLNDGTFTVGRSRRNQVIIDEDSVSSEHGQLLVYGPEVIVRERGSKNGTFVNGVRVQAQSGVKHGQIIRFGRVEVRLELEPVSDVETSVTALDSLRRLIRHEVNAPEPTKLPITFAPTSSPLPGGSE
jgi:pSer/pThr/pTyr-binding forkhead associated (FHA) protein